MVIDIPIMDFKDFKKDVTDADYQWILQEYDALPRDFFRFFVEHSGKKLFLFNAFDNVDKLNIILNSAVFKHYIDVIEGNQKALEEAL